MNSDIKIKKSNCPSRTAAPVKRFNISKKWQSSWMKLFMKILYLLIRTVLFLWGKFCPLSRKMQNVLFQYFTFFIEEHCIFSSFLVCQDNLIGLATILCRFHRCFFDDWFRKIFGDCFRYRCWKIFHFNGVKSFTAMTVSTPDVKFPANATVVPNPITNAIATIFFS